MNWLAVAAGLAAVWIVTTLFDHHGAGLAVLGAVAGAVIGGLHKKLAEAEAQWRPRLAQLEAEVQFLKRQAGTLPPAEPAAKPAPAPTPAPEPAVAPARAAAIEVAPPAPRAPPPRPPQAAPVRQVDEATLAVTSSLGQSLLAWVRGGNTIVRVAVLILFIGVAFLLRYAAQNVVVSIEWRITAVALGGLGLAALGWRLRHSRRTYGLTLQGAGVGIVYLCLFATYRLYRLIPSELTFALLAALAAITALLAVLQNALPLAVFGFGGGFLAPILASSQSGDHVALFSYDLLLNLAIAWIARRQAWKLLNLLGFLCTFGIAAAWGARSYTPDHFASTEPFLVVHFLLYLFIAVQYTHILVTANETQALTLPTVDGGLLFGVPIAAFGLQAAMLHDQPLALALSAAVMSGLYLLLGRWLWRVAARRMLLLVEGLLALGVIFLALVTPLALDARWTGVAWAIQGAGIVWVGLRQQRWWAAAMGLLLQGGAAVSFWSAYARTADTPAFFNEWLLGAAVLSAAALRSAHLLWRLVQAPPPTPQPPAARELHWVMLVLGLAQAGVGLWGDVLRLDLGAFDEAPRACLLLAAFVLALEAAQRPLRWAALNLCARALLLAGLGVSAVSLLPDTVAAATLPHAANIEALWHHEMAAGGAWVALALLALGLWLLRRTDREAAPGTHALEPGALAWFAMGHTSVLAYVLGAHLVARHQGWTPAAAIVGPTAVALWLIARGRAQPAGWPMHRHGHALAAGVLRPWLVGLMLWVLAVNAASDASMAPLPYLPLLNPMDLGHGLVVLYALALSRLETLLTPGRRKRGPPPEGAATVLGAARHTVGLPLPLSAVAGGMLAFWWLNSVLVRTLHHWADTPPWGRGALASEVVQTGLSILWTLTACASMWIATRRHQRVLWMAGAGLLAAVVLKLFFIDLSNVGTLARIVSFLGVGGLMLVIGYVAPMPPLSPLSPTAPQARRQEDQT